MKVEALRNEIVGDSGHRFGIELSPELYDLLMGRIYSDPIKAIIRELAVNAVDSHKAAGHNRPIKVTLPTWMCREFSIRDYGTGLSEKEIYEIYTVLGKSTKRDSNDFTGCLGIGSKSPFAYAQQFTVTSWYNGTKTIYTACRDEENYPTIVKLITESTDECNGLEIKMAVNSSDIASFERKAHEVFKFFEVTPEGIEISEEPFIQKTDTYGIVNGESYLIMGNVGYPIKQEGVYLYAPIGSVDISADRESLQYTKKTEKYLEKAYNEALEDYLKEVSDEINNAPTYWEACKVFHKNRYNKLFRKKDWFFNGVELSSHIEVNPSDYQLYSLDLRRRKHALYVDNKVYLVDEIPFRDRIKADGGDAYFKKEDHPTGQETLQEIVDRTGIPLIKVSSLPKQPKKRKGTTRKGEVFRYNPNSWGRNRWIECEPPEKGIYVTITNFQECDASGKQRGNTLEYCNSLFNVYKRVSIYGIKYKSAKNLGKGWVHLDTLLRKVIAKIDVNKVNKYLDAYKYTNLKQLVEMVGGINPLLKEAFDSFEFRKNNNMQNEFNLLKYIGFDHIVTPIKNPYPINNCLYFEKDHLIEYVLAVDLYRSMNP